MAAIVAEAASVFVNACLSISILTIFERKYIVSTSVRTSEIPLMMARAFNPSMLSSGISARLETIGIKLNRSKGFVFS